MRKCKVTKLNQYQIQKPVENVMQLGEFVGVVSETNGDCVVIW